MGGRHPASWQVAVGGMAAALCVVLLFLTGVVPFSTYLMPGMAGLVLVPVAVELGSAAGWSVYGAAGLLALLVAPDREAALLFLLFLGCYPMARLRMHRLQVVKWLWFNGAVAGCYGLLVWLFGMARVLGGQGAGWWPCLALLAVANGVFWIYDRAVANLTVVYLLRWRWLLQRGHRR